MSKNSTLIKFKLAQLCKGKEWFISYYVINPATEKLHRKKVKLNHIKSLVERKRYADFLIRELNLKLYQGWNPFLEDINPRGYKILLEVLENFLAVKKRELRKDSIRSYQSYIEILKVWLIKEGKEKITCEGFKKIDAVEFLEWAYSFRNLSARTFNNYRLFFSTLWNWLKEHQYVTLNYFEKIAKKTTTGKERIIIDAETRELIKDHLEKYDYNFLIVSMLVFHALIRPKEICNLKPSNFQLKNQIIKIPAEVAKNKHERVVTISNTLLKFLARWNFNGAKNNEYIFGTNILPGAVPLDARRLTKKWDKLREDLALDSKMKLYSLRDSGIIQMLQDGISPEEVMKQADHSSLDITTVYVRHANPSGSEQIKNKSTNF